MTLRLPLFPLGTVLYPGLVLPLHIFEERYRALVRDLVALPAEEQRFGVVAIREGHEVGADGVRALHGVGCTAVLQQVEPYEDGRFDIVTCGVARFRLGPVDPDGPYLCAEVDLLDEPAGADAAVLAGSVAQLFTAYRGALLGASGREADELELPGEPGVLSYLVASAVVLETGDKQRLLEAPDTATRLRAQLRLLRRETALLRELPSLPAVNLVRDAYGAS